MKACLPFLLLELKEEGDPRPGRDFLTEDPESGSPEGGGVDAGEAAAPLDLGVCHPSRLYGHEDDCFSFLTPLAGEEGIDGHGSFHDREGLAVYGFGRLFVGERA